MTATTPTPTPAERVEREGPIRRGIGVWFAVFIGPIGAWAAHLVAVTSLARASCTHTWAGTLSHVVTAITLAVALACMALSWRLVRAGGEDAHEDAHDPPGRVRFLGLVGLGIGAFNVALIVLEEVYIVAFHGHSCG